MLSENEIRNQMAISTTMCDMNECWDGEKEFDVWKGYMKALKFVLNEGKPLYNKEDI